MMERFVFVFLILFIISTSDGSKFKIDKEIPNADLIEVKPVQEFPGYDLIQSITISKSIHFTPKNRKKRAIISKEGICNFNPDGFSSCTPDCSGRILCKSGKVNSIIRCPDRRPFCDPETRTCVKQIDFCVYNSSLDIQADPPGYSYCDGKYQPDLKDCRMFSFCEDTYFYKYRCQGVSAFDPVREICSTQVQCYNFGDEGLCEGEELGTVEYPLDPTRFVICSANDTPFLGDCNYFGNNEINSTYNPKSSKCELNCKQEGRFDDPNDLSADYQSYVECIYDESSGRIKGYTRKCPDGTNYDVNDKICRQFPSLVQLRNKFQIGRVCSNSVYSKACSVLGEMTYLDYLRTSPNFQGTRVSCSEKDENGRVRNYLFKCNSNVFKNENRLPQCKGSRILGCSQNVTRYIANTEYRSMVDKYLLIYDCTGDDIYKNIEDVNIKGCASNNLEFINGKNVPIGEMMMTKIDDGNNFWNKFLINK